MGCQQIVKRSKGPDKGKSVPCGLPSKQFQVSGRTTCTRMALCNRHRHQMEQQYTVILTMEPTSDAAVPLPGGTISGEQGELL